MAARTSRLSQRLAFSLETQNEMDYLQQQLDTSLPGAISRRCDEADLSSITGTHATYSNVYDWDDDVGGAPATIPQAIYGRTKEMLHLLKIYEILLRTKQAQIVFVHGVSGSGKTALVEMIREQVFASHGSFVTGKYSQNSAIQEPYSAIMAAFSDLCDLTVQSEDFDKQRQTKFQEVLKTDVQYLAKAITNLSPFIDGNSSSHDTMEVEASFANFKVACKTFLRAMAQDNHPAVIFLDDVQWADDGSRLLIQMFMQDAELKNVMFILAYRDEESEQVVDLLEHARDRSIHIALKNLDVSAVHQMVCSILGCCTSDQIKDLSNLVAKRTAGNPFHVKMFIDYIVQERYLTFHGEVKGWIFNVDTIQEDIMVSDTLASLLTRKIERLSPEVKGALQVASLLGYCFDGSIVVMIACKTKEHLRRFSDEMSNFKLHSIARPTTFPALSEAVKGGFVEMTSNAGYHFAHDKLQATFQTLLDDREKERLHLLIGEAYLALGDDSKAMYNAAVHLNCAPGFVYDGRQRTKLAHINLDAAKCCAEKSAFVDAANMLRNGIDTLGSKERWSAENFDLSFEIMEALARAQLLSGHFEACKQTTREALHHGKTAEMKINLLLIDVEVRAAEFDVDDTILTANRALAILGVKAAPRVVSKRHLTMKLLKVRRMLMHKSDDALLSLPATEDLLMITAVKLLMYVCTVALNTVNKQTAILSALMAMELTLKEGISPYSPFAFAMYGVAEVTLGKVERAYRFSKLALLTLNRMENQEAACATVGLTSTLLSWWKEPTRELIAPLFQIGGMGYRRGDMFFGSYCESQSFAMQGILGTHLGVLEKAMRETYNKMSEMLGPHGRMLLWHQPYLQHTINMRSNACSWENMGFLSGEIMNEEDFFGRAEVAKIPVLRKIAMRVKAQEAVLFNRYHLAVSIYEHLENLGGHWLQISHRLPDSCWLAARANYELFQTTGKRRYLRKGRKYSKRLERMEANGCPNVSPYLIFLNAEAASRRRFTDDSSLHDMYDHAIEDLSKSDFVHLEGLLSERAGFDFVKRRRYEDANRYFNRAMHNYMHEWGSIAKYLSLEERSALALSGLYDTNRVEMPSLVGQCITVGSKTEDDLLGQPEDA